MNDTAESRWSMKFIDLLADVWDWSLKPVQQAMKILIEDMVD